MTVADEAPSLCIIGYLVLVVVCSVSPFTLRCLLWGAFYALLLWGLLGLATYRRRR
jgi:hypothetical protein